jgi:hypothetical protein
MRVWPWSNLLNITIDFRAPPRIHFGVPANLFDSGRRQEKAALASTKADSPSLPENKNLLLSAQKQLLELPLSTTGFLLIFVQSMHRLSHHFYGIARGEAITKPP